MAKTKAFCAMLAVWRPSYDWNCSFLWDVSVEAPTEFAKNINKINIVTVLHEHQKLTVKMFSILSVVTVLHFSKTESIPFLRHLVGLHSLELGHPCYEQQAA
jgi:hypothetical protein